MRDEKDNKIYSFKKFYDENLKKISASNKVSTRNETAKKTWYNNE